MSVSRSTKLTFAKIGCMVGSLTAAHRAATAAACCCQSARTRALARGDQWQAGTSKSGFCSLGDTTKI
jgi:hypothetical protein